MVTASFVSRAVEISLAKIDPSFTIRSKQLEAIASILIGQDTIAILPTSYGKSLIFRLLPSVCRQLRGHSNSAVVIVIVPLEAIIKDQIDSANKLTGSLGLKACRVDSSNLDKIKEQQFNIIIGTPEAWLEEESKDLLSSSYFCEHLKCIVVDEAHLV